MTKNLQLKLGDAKKAIRAVHSDQSGSVQQNLEAVRELIGDLQMIEQALVSDCERNLESEG